MGSRAIAAGGVCSEAVLACKADRENHKFLGPRVLRSRDRSQSACCMQHLAVFCEGRGGVGSRCVIVLLNREILALRLWPHLWIGIPAG